MSEHTPGQATPAPWEYTISDGIHADGKRIASLSYKGKPISQKVTYEEQQANARLIAAAPEMFEALNRIYEEFEAGTLGRNIESDGVDGWAIRAARGIRALAMVKQAIAKATGEGTAK